MNSAVVLSLLCLSLMSSPARQARTILARVEEDSLSERDIRLSLDRAGNLWMIDNFHNRIQATQINSRGKVKLDKLPIYEAKRIKLGSQVVFNSHNTAVFTIADGDKLDETTVMRLMHVTAKGKIADHYPWPQVPFHRNYLEILGADTLLVVGSGNLGETVIYHGFFEKDRIVPLRDTFYEYGSFSMNNIGSSRTYYRSILDWDELKGLRGDIYWYAASDSQGPDKLTLYTLSLSASDSFRMQEIDTYPWRDYVWRIYPGTWVRYMIFAAHEDGGYTLALPDPEDRSVTQVLRLDAEGKPIDPILLDEGGSLAPSNFSKLPGDAKPEVDIGFWKNAELELDSAHVVFWGLDKKGNLYWHREVRSY